MVVRSLPLALLLAGFSAPVGAEVVYTFEPTAGSPIYFSIDAATGAAFSVSGSAAPLDFATQPDIPLSLAGTGVDRISFNDGGIGHGFNSFASVSLGPSLYYNPGWLVNLSGGPAGVTGYLQYLGLYDDFTINLASPPAVTTGSFVTDNSLIYPDCAQSPGCSFSGLMDPPAGVPEPWSVGLLAFGFLGLLGVNSFRIRTAPKRAAASSISGRGACLSQPQRR